MRIAGYCTSCRKPKVVTVSASGIAKAQAKAVSRGRRGAYFEGICSDCERKARQQ